MRILRQLAAEFDDAAQTRPGRSQRLGAMVEPPPVFFDPASKLRVEAFSKPLAIAQPVEPAREQLGALSEIERAEVESIPEKIGYRFLRRLDKSRQPARGVTSAEQVR